MSEFISKYLTKHMSKYKGDFSMDYFNKLADCEAKAIRLFNKKTTLTALDEFKKSE